ncbi:MAG: adenylate/guanylate cyclase domain-containing protein [Nitrospinaceae bacterium]|nr:MAG: adenylate/guanylate cyclase domain-containing protein [Nitrospinaceae bacterium]
MKKAIPWIIGLAVTSILCLGYWLNPSSMHRMELLFQNAHFQWRGPLQPGPEVVIAAIDEKSIDEFGRWPWSRKTIAQLVDKLVESQAKVIGFDMVFSSPDDSSGKNSLHRIKEKLKEEIKDGPLVEGLMHPIMQEADNDAILASALKKSKRAILGFFFHFHAEEVRHLTAAERHDHFQTIKRAQFGGFTKPKHDFDLSLVDFRSGYAVESNIPMLSESARSQGYISFDIEPDGSMRRLPIIVKYLDKASNREYFFPPMSVRVLERYLKGALLFRVGEFGAEKVLFNGTESIEVPINEKGEMLVNFLGARGTFPHISIVDILRDGDNRVSGESLKGKIVLIGTTATAMGDNKVTPFDPAYPGVEIHATIIDNILRKNFLYQPGWIFQADLVYLLASGFFLTWMYLRIKPVRGALVCGLVAGAQFLLTQWVFVNHGFWITAVFPFLENILIFGSLTIHWYLTEKKQKHFIHDVFGKYLSPKVVDRLIEDPGQLQLGGEEKELTALFTDLAEFTTLSEKLSAQELVNLLNDYFTEMTEILLKHEGTLDKYDGDAIKAFFGAPYYFEDHAKRACWVAIEMQERLKALREQWKKEGRPELEMRIGLNTGMMVVGNLGSKNRMNYGMNGDSVNLAARLEGANKEYGTFTLISESTYEQAKDCIEVRELDSIRVVGRTTPVRIFELLGKKGSLDETTREILGWYQKGLGFYREGDWEEAITQFKNVLEKRPQDGPSFTLLNRCQLLGKSFPQKKWDGIYSMPAK